MNNLALWCLSTKGVLGIWYLLSWGGGGFGRGTLSFLSQLWVIGTTRSWGMG